jgi:hypothetical protein
MCACPSVPAGAVLLGECAGLARTRSEHDVDIYTIIFAALAVFVCLRLYSVLGQRTGYERPSSTKPLDGLHDPLRPIKTFAL